MCQLCQQSPRLFTNHAAQLHTLLVSWTSKVFFVVELSREVGRTLCYVKVEWLNGFVFTGLLRVSTVSRSTAWITQRHSSQQPCGWVSNHFLYMHLFSLPILMIRFSRLTHIGCCFSAHYTPGAVDIHCNQLGQCLHQGRKQTSGGKVVERNKANTILGMLIIILLCIFN